MTRREIEYAIDEQAKESSLDLGMARDDLVSLPSQKRFATIVTGVRRCGKSTLLRQWAHGLKVKVVSVLFDDLRLMNFSSQDFILLGKILSDRKVEAVVLDEVQDIDGWELFVNGLLNQGLFVFALTKHSFSAPCTNPYFASVITDSQSYPDSLLMIF